MQYEDLCHEGGAMLPYGFVRRRKAVLEEVEMRLFRCRRIWRQVENGRWIWCIAWCDIEALRIDVALYGHRSFDELVHSVIHELCHWDDTHEDEVDGKLDNAAYTSPALREAVQRRVGDELRLLQCRGHRNGHNGNGVA